MNNSRVTCDDAPSEQCFCMTSPAQPSEELAALSEQLILQGRQLAVYDVQFAGAATAYCECDLRLPKMIKQMSSFEGLIIDDLGYVQQSREEMEVLFTLLAERYATRSVLLTSNLAFSKWDQTLQVHVDDRRSDRPSHTLMVRTQPRMDDCLPNEDQRVRMIFEVEFTLKLSWWRRTVRHRHHAAPENPDRSLNNSPEFVRAGLGLKWLR